MLLPVVTYSIGFVHLPEDAVLNAGDLKPLPEAFCSVDVITAGDISLTASVFHFLVT